MGKKTKDTQLGIKQLLTVSWEVFVSNFSSFFIIALVFTFPLELFKLMSPEESSRGSFYTLIYSLLDMIFYLILNSLITMSIAFFVEKRVLQQDVTYKLAINNAILKCWRGFKTDIVTIFYIGLALILFIIPGIYFRTLYVFGLQVVILRNISGTDAIDYSAELVNNHWWRVFTISFLVDVFVLVPFVILNMLLSRILLEPLVGLVSSLLVCLIIPYRNIVITLFFLHLDYLRNGIPRAAENNIA